VDDHTQNVLDDALRAGSPPGRPPRALRTGAAPGLPVTSPGLWFRADIPDNL